MPYQLALYSNWLTNCDQATSEMLLANLWFLSILETYKYTTQIISFSLINLVDNLWEKSNLWFAICSCSLATFILALFQFELPIDFGSFVNKDVDITVIVNNQNYIESMNMSFEVLSIKMNVELKYYNYNNTGSIVIPDEVLKAKEN